MKRIALLLVATTIALITVGATHRVTAQLKQTFDHSNSLELSTSIEPIPHPILSDVRIRRAIAHCTNKDALIASVYPGLTPEQRQELVMDTFVPRTNWAYTAPTTTYSLQPDGWATTIR